jgi:hypothetical protein
MLNGQAVCDASKRPSVLIHTGDMKVMKAVSGKGNDLGPDEFKRVKLSF